MGGMALNTILFASPLMTSCPFASKLLDFTYYVMLLKNSELFVNMHDYSRS